MVEAKRASWRAVAAVAGIRDFREALRDDAMGERVHRASTGFWLGLDRACTVHGD